MKLALLRFVSCLVLFALAGLSSCEAKPPHAEIQFTNSDGTSSPTIEAELALSRSEQQLGLMYRKTLPENDGMLFVFAEEKPRSFWMKNTYLELDIIFLDKDLKVVSIAEKAVPLTETPRASTGPAQYVLEVAGGRSKAWGIAAGSRARLAGALPRAAP